MSSVWSSDSECERHVEAGDGATWRRERDTSGSTSMKMSMRDMYMGSGDLHGQEALAAKKQKKPSPSPSSSSSSGGGGGSGRAAAKGRRVKQEPSPIKEELEPSPPTATFAAP